jgi:vanillate O-demethylase monooxygenase subunit
MSNEHSFDHLLDGPSAEAIAAFRKGMLPFWHPVMEVSELSSERPVGVTLLGRRLAIARLDGALVALPDICRHFQARLSLGTLVPVGAETGIQCAYHGWTFGKSGQCLRIPQLAAGRPISATARLPTYQAVERYGLVWVCLAEAATFPIPDFPEIDDPAFRTVRLREADPTKTSATRMVMGTLDDTHFPWVHEGILGDRNHPEPPDHRVWRDGGQLVVRYEIEQPPSLVSTDTSQAAPEAGGPIKILYTDYVAMPNTIRLVKDSPSGRYVIWLASSPIDYDRAHNFWMFARNFDLDPAKDAAFEALSAHVRQQDKPIIESQRPWIIPPFWTHIEMPIGPADLPLIEYQRWLQELEIATAI